MAELLHLIGYRNIVGLDASDAWSLEEQSDLFRTYPFSSEYASLRHWINVHRKAE